MEAVDRRLRCDRCRHPVVLYNNNRFEGEMPRATSAFWASPSSAGRVDVGRDARPGMVWRRSRRTLARYSIVNPFPTAFVLTLRGDGVKRALDAANHPL